MSGARYRPAGIGIGTATQQRRVTDPTREFIKGPTGGSRHGNTAAGVQRDAANGAVFIVPEILHSCDDEIFGRALRKTDLARE